jgi:hypothetical protein
LFKVEELHALVAVLDKAAPQDVDRLFACGQFAVAGPISALPLA